jgi:hypothetical protein
MISRTQVDLFHHTHPGPTVGIYFQDTPLLPQYLKEARAKIVAALWRAGVVFSHDIESFKRIFNLNPVNSIYSENPANIIIHPDYLSVAGKALAAIDEITFGILWGSGYQDKLKELLTVAGIELGSKKAPVAAARRLPVFNQLDDKELAPFTTSDSPKPHAYDKICILSCTLFGGVVGCAASGCSPVGGLKGAVVGAAVVGYAIAFPVQAKPASPSFSRS